MHFRYAPIFMALIVEFFAIYGSNYTELDFMLYIKIYLFQMPFIKLKIVYVRPILYYD